MKSFDKRNSDGEDRLADKSLSQEDGPDKRARGKGMLDAVVTVSNIGWTIVACLLVGVLLGRWLDNKTGLDPVFTIIGSILGVASAIWFLFNFSRKFNRKK